ncbi:MAG: hypothetical protein KatS3mg084_0559 [Candidatus Dojkabacteria bacterium]|jgi:hypothetical protein|nr:MAG: hypothetical protein KatS3mg084_0559 [Candidatus Dojkabacteria bacterium]
MDNTGSNTTNASINQNASNGIINDPYPDVDLSNIEIIDTSKGGQIPIQYQGYLYENVRRIKCLNCGFLHEGINPIQRCPHCNSDNLIEIDS